MLKYIMLLNSIIILLTGCASNDGESNPVTSNGSLVIGTLTIENIDEWPSDKNIVFQMYIHDNSDTPEVEVEISKPLSDNVITIRVEGVSKKTYEKVQLVEDNQSTNDTKLLVDYGQIIVSSNTETLSSKTIKFNNSGGLSFSRIQTEIINTSCLSCHSTSNPLGGLDLSPGVSYNNLINILAVKDSDFLQVKPFESYNSYFYLTLVDSFDAPLMPPLPLEELGPNQIELVRKWIDAGALNN
jgi:hypothetical protein